jgi:23S rRNA pseudouridine1911/1915/1917 synthase
MIYRFEVDSGESEWRLDIFLQRQLPEISRTQLRKIIDLGGVHVDGRRTRQCGLQLKPGQRLELHTDEKPLIPYRIGEPDVVFQDKYIIVLNKPAGVATQPTPARYKGTLYEALQHWLQRDTRFGRKLEIGMVQRLDRDTSGLIIFSIHPRAHKNLADQFRERTVTKKYLALISGCPDPPEGEIRTNLARNRRTGQTITVESGGKEAVTRYRVYQTVAATTLLEVELITGRTHQIRSHLAQAGYPLLGDSKYGGQKQYSGRTYSRQCLHSWQLAVNHPISGSPLRFTAPLPEDMAISST